MKKLNNHDFGSRIDLHLKKGIILASILLSGCIIGMYAINYIDHVIFRQLSDGIIRENYPKEGNFDQYYSDISENSSKRCGNSSLSQIAYIDQKVVYPDMAVHQSFLWNLAHSTSGQLMSEITVFDKLMMVLSKRKMDYYAHYLGNITKKTMKNINFPKRAEFQACLAVKAGE